MGVLRSATSGCSSTSSTSAAIIVLPKLLQLVIIGVVIVGNMMMMVGVMASDPDPVEDFCVGDLSSNITLNGLVCKNPKLVVNEDFAFSGLEKPGNTSVGPYGGVVTMAFAAQFPGINTQGLAMARLDFAANGGLNVPHWHPRASEMLFVVNGTLLVGFVDGTNRLWSNTLRPGGVTVFPRGLVHFQLNTADTPALAIAVLNSQNPGRLNSGNSLFGTDIPDSILEKTFNLTRAAVQKLKKFFQAQNQPAAANLNNINQERPEDQLNLNNLLEILTEENF